MNPDRMRSDYGKLIYMLMDSADLHVRELLEFDCVKPLLTGAQPRAMHAVRRQTLQAAAVHRQLPAMPMPGDCSHNGNCLRCSCLATVLTMATACDAHAW